MLIVELKSDALKERHWKQLQRQLRVRWVLSELTLGQVWDVDLQKNEHVVKDVILVAQGEMAPEQFLKQVSRRRELGRGGGEEWESEGGGFFCCGRMLWDRYG